MDINFLKGYKKKIIFIILILLIILLLNYFGLILFSQFLVVEDVILPKSVFKLNETAIFTTRVRNIGLLNLFKPFSYSSHGGLVDNYNRINCTYIRDNYFYNYTNLDYNEVIDFRKCYIEFEREGTGFVTENICYQGVLFFGKICGPEIVRHYMVTK